MGKPYGFKYIEYFMNSFRRSAWKCNYCFIIPAAAYYFCSSFNRPENGNSVDCCTDKGFIIIKKGSNLSKNLFARNVIGNHLPGKSCTNYIELRITFLH